MGGKREVIWLSALLDGLAVAIAAGISVLDLAFGSGSSGIEVFNEVLVILEVIPIYSKNLASFVASPHLLYFDDGLDDGAHHLLDFAHLLDLILFLHIKDGFGVLFKVLRRFEGVEAKLSVAVGGKVKAALFVLLRRFGEACKSGLHVVKLREELFSFSLGGLLFLFFGVDRGGLAFVEGSGLITVYVRVGVTFNELA